MNNTATPIDPDRAFWLAVRAALKAIVAAIEQRWGLGKYAPGETVTADGERMTVTRVYNRE